MPLSMVLKKLRSTQNSGLKSEATLWLEIARNTESRARKIPYARNGLPVIVLGNQELESHLMIGSVRIAVLPKLNVGCNVWSLNKKMTEIFGISKSFKILIITNTRITLTPQPQLAPWIRLKTLKKLIKDHQKTGIPIKSTYNALKLNNPENSVIMRDITNERARAKFADLDGNTPITAFFKGLDSKFNNQPDGDEFFFRYRTKNSIETGGPLTHLFIASSFHTYFLIKNPEVLTIDATYKTNRFRIPLVNIIGMTGMNRNFYTTSIFLAGEKEEDYDMVFSGLKMLYDF